MNGKKHRIAIVLLVSVITGFGSGLSLGYNGYCEVCVLTVAGAGCPDGKTCKAVTACFVGTCNARAAPTGTCKLGWGTCWNAVCPVGLCVGGAGLSCQCLPSGGCL